MTRGTTVSLSAEEGATIYSTLDGSDPTIVNSGSVSVGNSFNIDGTQGALITVKACAKKNNRSISELETFT